jgi:hypothetical protein
LDGGWQICERHRGRGCTWRPPWSHPSCAPCWQEERRLAPASPRQGRLIFHKYRGSCVALSISKSVEPNKKLKVG